MVSYIVVLQRLTVNFERIVVRFTADSRFIIDYKSRLYGKGDERPSQIVSTRTVA